MIEDADLAAILKEADPENFEPDLNDADASNNDDDDDDTSSNDNFATRTASVTCAAPSSDNMTEAIGRYVPNQTQLMNNWHNS